MEMILLGLLFLAACCAVHAWEVLYTRRQEWEQPLPRWCEQTEIELEARIHPDSRSEVQAEREARAARMGPQSRSGALKAFPRRTA